MDNTIIKIDEIPRVEWRSERVMTTAQLADFYETSADNIRRNFSNNRDHFVEGKHFFKLEDDALQRFRKIFPEALDKFSPSLYLWTKRGAARHAKMLNTDRAWEVFEALEDNYFNRPAVADPLANAISEMTAVEREKLLHARDDFAKAQLLRELASASGDERYVRSKLVRTAANLLMGDDFFKKIPDEDNERICI